MSVSGGNSGREYRRRGQVVLEVLRQLWGEDLPTGPQSEVTVLSDAVAVDDGLGRGSGYLVHGDRLSYHALGRLLQDGRTPGLGAALLSIDLFARAVRAGINYPGATGSPLPAFPVPGALVPAPTAIDLRCLRARPAPRPATDRGGQVGAWHLDVGEQTLSWDRAGARLLGREGAIQHASVLQELAATHPEDRVAVAGGFQRCINNAIPHHARFRVLGSHGDYVACEATGRRVADAHGKVHLVGFLYGSS